MKVTDIFESQQLNERPLGMLKQAGLGIASKLGSQSAGNKLVVGDRANFLRQKFNSYLQTSGQQATADSLVSFLNSVGYPTDSAEKIVRASPAQPSGATQPSGQQTPTGKSAPQQKSAQAQQQPAARQTAQQTQPASNKADTDPYEKFKGQIRQVQSGSKPLPDKMIAGVEADIAKLGKGDKESGSFAAQKILNFAKAGYDVSGLSSKWTANSKAGERFLTQSVFIAISKMLQEHGLYWSDLGIKLRLDESVSGGVYISLLEEVRLDDKIIDQALTAAVQDAFKTGMLQVGADGKVKVGKGSSGSNSTGRTLGNQSGGVDSLEEIKKLFSQLDQSGQQQVVQFLEKNTD